MVEHIFYFTKVLFQIQKLPNKFEAGRAVLKSPVSKQKAARRMRDHKVALYKQLGVKAVVREDGRMQWFGCKKETQVRSVPLLSLK